MTKYKLVDKENSPNRHKYYELDTPINGIKKVLVSQSDILTETMIFPVVNEQIDWGELWSAKAYKDHEEALVAWLNEVEEQKND